MNGKKSFFLQILELVDPTFNGKPSVVADKAKMKMPNTCTKTADVKRICAILSPYFSM